ncbi:SpoIID/LytB domain-containing protein [Egicoccus sp. AB-alg6-2]|uniref:SpoIID/LytB domain-containing protein n=1 Tax=Egicoccus sp. AB-alg6-2 TaxID=3242692 RepID=UPI00359DBDF2
MADRDGVGGVGGRPAPVTVTLASLCALLAVLLVPSAPAAAAETVSGVLRAEAAGGVIEITDDVRGPRRFLDTLEMRAGSSGTLLVNELGLDDYVAGVAEMPPRWHLEALKAQAVAARTYAWYSIRLGTFTHYDICATVACQVFRGADVELDDLGARWRQAVDATAGEVLVDEEGRPILARYFSTSGGQTYANEFVFPNEGPRPYLVGTDDPLDAVSPYHRWTVRFTRAQFDDIIGRGDTLGRAAPVADVRREGSLHDPFGDITVVGEDGTEVTIGVRPFREFVSRIAAERYPDQFPGIRGDGLRRLPETLPSSRFEVVVDAEAVTFEGRGWGHGVGMSQYGARGRAEDGQDYRQILAAYYDGREPTVTDDLPSRVRVGLNVDDRFTLRPTRSMRLVAGDIVVAEAALGTWTVAREGDGWSVSPPDGHDRDLEVSATRAADGLEFGDAVVVEAEINKPALLRLVVQDADGGEILVNELGAADPGVHAATWRYDDAQGDPVAPGEYTLTLFGRDAAGAEDGAPYTVTVARDDVAAAEDTRDRAAAGGTRARVVALAVVAVLLVLLVLANRSRRRSA